MKLKYEMEILDMDGAPVAVPVDGGDDFRGVIHMNETARDIIELLKKDVTEDEIVLWLENEYDASAETIRENVRGILKKLKENDLICEK